MARARSLSMGKAEIDELSNALRDAMHRRVDAGLVPNAGQWVKLSVLEKEIRQERAKAYVRALELLLLYTGCALVSLLLLGIFWYLSY